MTSEERSATLTVTLTEFGAIMHNDLDRLRSLLEAPGADPDVATGIGHQIPPSPPPLHFAAGYGNMRAVQMILEHGANVLLKDKRFGQTALHRAVRDSRTFRNHDVCKLLLERGIDSNEQDGDGATVLHRALQFADVELAQLLLDHGADITAVDIDGNTALHYAVWNPDEGMIQFVLEQGSGALMVNRKTKTNQTPMNSCLIAINRKTWYTYRDRVNGGAMVQLLLEYGAKVDRIDLEIAAENNDEEAVRNVLMQHIARRHYLNLEVAEEDLQFIQNRNCYKKFYQRCLQELKTMTETKLCNGLSVSFLLKSEKVIAGYARNGEIVKALEEIDYTNRFPIYFSSLKKRFDVIVKKQRMRRAVAEVLSDIFKFNDPYHPVNRDILTFLGDADLKFLEMQPSEVIQC